MTDVWTRTVEKELSIETGPPPEKEKTDRSIYLRKDQIRKLEEMAENQDKSVSAVVRTRLDESLEG